MFKQFVIVLLALVAYAAAEAKPGLVAPLAYTAPAAVVAAAQAAAVYSREYHGNYAAPYVAGAAPYIASPYAAAPYIASPYAAAPYVAAPYAAAPYVAAPYAAAPYVAAPYAAAYTAPVLLKK